MADPNTISGLLKAKDVKRLTRLTRGGTVGPTALYYAGVTAPVISASMAFVVRHAAEVVGLTDYWQWFVSALVAAFAGIAWYLIFIRWSYRHGTGRGTEMTELTFVSAADEALIVTRAGIEIRIDWVNVEEVKSGRGHTTILIRGADALIVPDSWFQKDKTARKEFIRRLIEKAPD